MSATKTIPRISVSFLLASLLALSGCASMSTPDESEMVMQTIHEVDLSKKEIFNRSQEWMAQAFVDSKEVVQLAEEDTGTIIGKGSTSIYSLGISEIPVRFTMRIDIKEGRYRTTYDDWIGHYGENDSWKQSLTTQGQVASMKKELESLDQSLLQHLKSSDDSNDW